MVLLTSLGTWGLPQMVQKFYAIKSETAVHKGMIISTVFALIVAGGCYFLGGFGRLFSDQVDVAADGYDSIIPTMLSGLPDVLIAIVVILVLSASMSTLSSLVLASSSTLTLDFLKDNFVKDMKEKTQVLIMRVLIVIFIAISVVIAIVQYRSNVTFIAQLMGISWGALAGAFLAPFLYGLYWKKATKAGCWASFLFSVVVMLANMLAPQLFPAVLRSSINAGAFCMLAGLVIVPAVSLVTPQAGPEAGGRRLLLLRPEGAGAPAGGPGRPASDRRLVQKPQLLGKKRSFSKPGSLWYPVSRCRGARFSRARTVLRERTVSVMVIDIHTHTFPDKLAATTIPKLEGMSHTRAYVDGTAAGLRASMARAGVDASLVLPVATNPRQVAHVNDSSAQHQRPGPGDWGSTPSAASTRTSPTCRAELARVQELWG